MKTLEGVRRKTPRPIRHPASRIATGELYLSVTNFKLAKLPVAFATPKVPKLHSGVCKPWCAQSDTLLPEETVKRFAELLELTVRNTES